KSQFPAAVITAKNVGQVALDALLPDVAFKGVEELSAALSGEPNHAGEFAQDGPLHDSLGDGRQGAVTIDVDLHVFVITRLQLDVHQHISVGLIFQKCL